MKHYTLRLFLKTLIVVSTAFTSVCGAPLTVETNSIASEWVVRHEGRPVFSYAFAPGRYKPYVKTLATIEGRNLLRDAPFDHLHHHALMYAVGVNGLNFWEEVAGSGIQLPVESTVTPPAARSPGRSEAGFSQVLHWLAPEHAFLPDTAAHALLIERRILKVAVDAPRREVALTWRSEFEVGPATNEVTLEGSNYFGLGVRFLAELDPLAKHFTARGGLDLADNRQDVSQHPWVAVAFPRSEAPATLAMLGDPKNAGGAPWFFSMKTPFAYLSATQRLDQQPRRYGRGERFTLQYLVTVTPKVATPTTLEARYQRWLNE
jgi:hypothetical protein